MEKIFKYDLHYHSVPEMIELPKGAAIVGWGVQKKEFKIWALVNPKEQTMEKRVFLLAMTGQGLDYKIVNMLGTKVLEDIGIVIHLLELDPKTKAADHRKDKRMVAN